MISRVIRWLAAMIALPGIALAEEAPLRDLQTCIDQEAARYERVLGWHRGRALEAGDFDLWTGWYVELCGNEAIALCDRATDAPECKTALADRQSALAARVQAGLPGPETVAGPDWPVTLYGQWYALAAGRSAGPDCAGAAQDADWASWCVARNANGQLQGAILAWQVARYLGATEPAVALGWARAVPPLRPRARDVVAQDD